MVCIDCKVGEFHVSKIAVINCDDQIFVVTRCFD